MEGKTRDERPSQVKSAVAERRDLRRPADGAAPKGETIKNQKLKSGPDDVILGVRMKAVFDLAKEFAEMPLDQV